MDICRKVLYRCIDVWIYIANCINLYIEERTNKSEQNKKSDIVYIIFKYLYKIIEAKSKVKRPRPYNMMC